MKELFDLLKEFVSLPVVLIFVIFLQIIKKQLSYRKITFKDENSWFWITIAAGPIIAVLVRLTTVGFADLNIYQVTGRLIIESVAYSGGCTIVYRLIRRIKIKQIMSLFSDSPNMNTMSPMGTEKQNEDDDEEGWL